MTIPEDIRDKARELANDAFFSDWEPTFVDISKALLSERTSTRNAALEEAAAMADEKATGYEEDADLWTCSKPIAVRLRGLATAIRKGKT